MMFKRRFSRQPVEIYPSYPIQMSKTMTSSKEKILADWFRQFLSQFAHIDVPLRRCTWSDCLGEIPYPTAEVILGRGIGLRWQLPAEAVELLVKLRKKQKKKHEWIDQLEWPLVLRYRIYDPKTNTTFDLVDPSVEADAIIWFLLILEIGPNGPSYV